MTGLGKPGGEQPPVEVRSLVRQQQAKPAPVTPETAGSAVAAQAQALVIAHRKLALERPRDWEDTRTNLLKSCQRKGLAERAIWKKPVGRTFIYGPSIRLVEEIFRCMGNVQKDAVVVYDDIFKRIVRVTIVDMERNLPFSHDVVVEKTVERHSQDGREVVGERTNTYGKTVFIVRATDDEVLVKQNALISKAVREEGKRLCPADILDEAYEMCKEVQKEADAEDPSAARRKVTDAFFELGVQPSEVQAFMRKPVEQFLDADLELLRGIYSGIKDGETTWAEVVESRDDAMGKKPEAEKPPTKGTAGLRAALKKDEPVAAATETAEEKRVREEDRLL